MGNTFSNMRVANTPKELVSKKKRRYKQDGFDLDLTYIRDNVIAMGYPGEKVEGLYRNHIDDVVKFLDSKHKDHYRIYNLCSERSYDPVKFHLRVATYPFDDHNPPNLELINPFCDDVHSWLTKDIENVAVVHCKAGKGRTGVMICCYLLHAGLCETSSDALSFYDQARTHDRKGVTIPSQQRYVGYYESLIHKQLVYQPTVVQLKEIRLEPVKLVNGNLWNPQFVVTQTKVKIYTSTVYEPHRQSSMIIMTINPPLVIRGDVKIEIFNKSKMKLNREKLLQFWFNTMFVTNEVQNSRDSLDEASLMLSLNKWELDKIHKDRHNKILMENFNVELYFLPYCDEVDNDLYHRSNWRDGSTASGEQVTDHSDEPSESDAESSDSEDDCDSAGVGKYRLLSDAEVQGLEQQNL